MCRCLREPSAYRDGRTSRKYTALFCRRQYTLNLVPPILSSRHPGDRVFECEGEGDAGESPEVPVTVWIERSPDRLLSSCPGASPPRHSSPPIPEPHALMKPPTLQTLPDRNSRFSGSRP